MVETGTNDYRIIGTFGDVRFFTIITQGLGLKALANFSQNTAVNFI